MIARLYVFLLLFSAVVPASGAHAQDDEGQQFKKKVLGAWGPILEGINSARWEQRIHYHSGRSENDLKLGSVDVLRQAFKKAIGSLSSLEEDEVDENGKLTRRRTEIDLANPQYGANLRASPGGSGWILTELKQEPEYLEGRLRKADRCPWMRIHIMPLNRWLQEPGFVFTKVEQRPDQPSSRLLRGHFAYGDLEGQPSEFFPYIKSGYIDFEVEHSYRPVAYKLAIRSPLEETDIKGVVEYEDGAGIPTPKLLKQEAQSRSTRKGSIWGKEIHAFSNVKYNGNVPDEEFHLSFYGLPEPRGVIWRMPTPWYLWFIAGGALLVGLGVILGRRLARGKPGLSKGITNPEVKPGP